MTKSKLKYPMPPKKQNLGKRDIKKQLIQIKEENVKLGGLIKRLRHDINAVHQVHSRHIALFSHFLSHDIKNCVQSIDMTLSANSLEELSNDHIKAMKQQLQIIRETLANFTDMNPHGELGVFKINSLIGNVEALNRDLLKQSGVSFHKELLNDIELKVNYPFHSLLQILSNLIINACTHLVETKIQQPSILLKIAINQEKQMVYLYLYDNGNEIDEKEQAKIFDYGYTTSPNGSGIGLYHVRYVCETLYGTVEYIKSDLPNYTKAFLISLPFKPLEI